MPKYQTHPTSRPRKGTSPMRITIQVRKVASRVRGSQPPTTQVHRNLKAYKRKAKHPNRTDSERT